MQSTISNAELDQRIEFLRQISAIQVKLFRPGIESEFPDEEQKKKFKKERLKWSVFVETVEIDIATVLHDKLEENNPEFEAGIQAINEQIQEIDDTVGFLNLLGSVISVLGKIVDLAM